MPSLECLVNNNNVALGRQDDVALVVQTPMNGLRNSHKSNSANPGF